jgi:peptidoglycan L-alanyl-D-glutamate endopeptidase CwlK
MRRMISWGAVLAAAIAAAFVLALGADATPKTSSDIPADLQRLARAYPDEIMRVENDGVVMKSGATISFGVSDESEPYEQRLAHASLSDQMSVPYPAGAHYATPTGNDDPGRLRNIPFFQAMYGASEAEVRRRLVPVRWLGREALLMTSVNGVDKALARVSAALMRLPPERLRCAYPSAGTFTYRIVAGTNYLSAHSFGIAIDLNLACSDYWYWDQQRSANGAFAYKSRMPLEIVEAFEHEGFIWGGKWAHYDTMHFEYRPELLPAR